MVNWTNITTPEQFLGIPNDNTAGAFWLVVTFLIWIVVTVGFIPFGVEVGLLASTFLVFVASVFLVYMGLLAWGWALFFLGFLIFMILYIVWSSSKDI